jgi:hypothetical protein
MEDRAKDHRRFVVALLAANAAWVMFGLAVILH